MLRRYSKGIAIILLMTFGQELVLPGTIWALTGGPSQPEVNSFEPVGTNQMVDLSTGDFNYNIPLMVVPGPNGGYPINLAYHAGIGMEQEASWVGLGWNINPGAITRNMRGVPDDFSGDEIIKTTNLKPDVTVGMSVTAEQLLGGDSEKGGYNFAKAVTAQSSFKVYFNNYRGVGYRFSVTPVDYGKIIKTGNKAGSENILTAGLNLSFDSNAGIGISGKVGLSKHQEASSTEWNQSGFSVGVGMTTRQGLNGIRFGQSFQDSRNNKKSWGNNISFVMQTYVPATNNTMIGTRQNLGFGFSKKTKTPDYNKTMYLRGEVMVNELKNNTRNYRSYGTINLEKAATGSAGVAYDQIMDVNVYNDLPITRRSVNMGLPIMTNDIFSISGQGIGGTFRGHRNDIGRFYAEGNTSNMNTVSKGNELAPGSKEGVTPEINVVLLHLGTDLSGGFHKSYTGKWGGGVKQIEHLKFGPTTEEFPLYEPFYFKVAGEKTAVDITEWDYMNNQLPVMFGLGTDWLSPGSPKIKANDFGILQNRPKNRDRVKRIQNIQFRKKEELRLDEFAADRPAHIFEQGEYPDHESYFGDQINYNGIEMRPGGDEEADHHIHEYTILRPDGSKYTYGLPAYISAQEEVVLANVSGANDLGMYEDIDRVTYDSDDASINNDEGIDHYYSSTILPSYVHSHMITQITSADYVDLTNNGPSSDDFGFYVKFNYQEVVDYSWRDPFTDADYIKGYYSNEFDDKASFAYGRKNLYYVHSIETKTHVAVFELADREDGKGVSNEIVDGEIQGRNQSEGSDLGTSQKYLKSIKLYSKKDSDYGTVDAVPLQTIHFEYSYELCVGVENTTNAPYDHDNNPDTDLVENEGGKLTLKKVYITYNGNEKGRLSPYEFSYDSNPNYNRLDIDRWGNHQLTDIETPYENVTNPYTKQHRPDAERIQSASAWNLSQINLPSGGEININYDADDYGYVQNQRAAEMVRIFGFTPTSQDNPVVSESLINLNKKNLRLWFHAEELATAAGPDERNLIVKDYVEGLDEIYFKVFQKLKRFHHVSGEFAQDYVVGYAAIDNTSYGVGENEFGYFGYVDLKDTRYKTLGLKSFKVHPFRKAGWQYLRYNRSDLFNNPMEYDDFNEAAGDALLSIPIHLIDPLAESITLATMGEYNKYNMMGYCDQMSTEKKSFVRLNSPFKHKYGGGHRVESIRLSDNWAEDERTFGTSYHYKNEDGTTSGVADYEPIVGGEENALKKPIWFDGNDRFLNIQEKSLYHETPFAEAVYPGARVVYGRVVVKNESPQELGLSLDPNIDVSFSQAGITENKFYTALDFPVIEKSTDLNRRNHSIPIYVPFLGLSTVQNSGYSQGYSVELNDMSGKPESVSTYPYRNGEIEGEPISEIIYHYKTDSQGNLDNVVNVLDAHGQTRSALVGVEQDFTVYEEEQNSQTKSMGLNVNTDTRTGFGYVGATYSILSLFPILSSITTANSEEATYRGISTSKVIYKTGILESVEAFTDGSTVITKNLLYDAETGEALLTSVNNEWDKPIYNYNYAAHWNYDAMGGAYKNYKANVYIEGDIAGELMLYNQPSADGGVVLPATYFLLPGDELTVKEGGTYVTYYVSSVSGPTFDLEDADGNSVLLDEIKGEISRSGRRNLQSVKSGSIVALSTNFLYANNDVSSQFQAWNNHITGANPQYGSNPADRTYIDLNTGTTEDWPGTETWTGVDYFVPNNYDCHSGNYYTLTIESDAANYSNDIIMFLAPGSRVGILTFDGHDDPILTPREAGHIFPVVLEGGTISYTEQLVNFRILSNERNVAGDVIGVNLLHIPSGITYHATWTEPAAPFFKPCLVSDILHADAVVFSDDWGSTYPYADLGNPENEDGTSIADGSINVYRYGKKGIWRAKKTYLYQIDRKQSGSEPQLTQINIDGEYEPWEPYSWLDGALNPKWDWVSEITKYSPYGYRLEEKSRLNNGVDDPLTDFDETTIYSSQMYGYDNSVVIATSALSTYFEIGYTGFEQLKLDAIEANTGHIDLNSGGTIEITDTKSHTGANSLQLTDGQEVTFESILFDESSQVLQGIEGKEYVVSLWVNIEETDAEGKLEVFNGMDPLENEFDEPILAETNEASEIIDGWKKLEIKFIMPNAPVTVKFTSTGTTYLDDVRIGPYDGGMVTYVYSPKNLWLLAELDGLNYATFYNYDEEGNLVQVKKETEKGIVTVKAARSNTLRRIGE